MHWNTIRQFSTARFIVALQWQREEDDYLPPWIDAKAREKINSGEWTNCCFRVAVFLDGQRIESNYLGNSIYADPTDFGREHIGSNHDDGRAYFSDMLREAIASARRMISAMPAKPHVRKTA